MTDRTTSESTQELVETITRRVKEALAQSESAPLPSPKPRGHVEGQACNATSSQCSGHGRCSTQKDQTIKKMITLGATRISSAPGGDRPSFDIARRIDHTLLKSDATKEDLDRTCDEAIRYHFATVCVNSSNIPYVARKLKGSDVKPIAVVGFPLGAMSTSSKVYETVEAVRNGAREIDMVMNIGGMKSKDYVKVYEDIRQVVEAARPYKVKVILETAALSYEEKISGCTLAKAAGAAFVKTSTGFGPGGATADDIALMRSIVGEDMEVKASGGIRNREIALAMLDAGADRIGASASVEILQGKSGKGSY